MWYSGSTIGMTVARRYVASKVGMLENGATRTSEEGGSVAPPVREEESRDTRAADTPVPSDWPATTICEGGTPFVWVSQSQAAFASSTRPSSDGSTGDESPKPLRGHFVTMLGERIDIAVPVVYDDDVSVKLGDGTRDADAVWRGPARSVAMEVKESRKLAQCVVKHAFRQMT